jgi:hypothetical protein
VTPIRATGGRLVKTIPTNSAKIGFGSRFDDPTNVRNNLSMSGL